ncbi:MAG: endonuclease/exonuclease/phosphatase [Gemmatimonadetes bacterium]|nr:endonuclease/exonuclease/phosphatase [Gemmatimonadota bacterium]MYI06899.1 endonuclease/exonuclease/phosphatase [Gemmatimonadota bacterium]
MILPQIRESGRALPCAWLAWAVLFLAPSAGPAAELRIAAWNLEHLDDTDGAGCVGRTGADYAVLQRRIAALGADIVAFQEVENAAAAYRVFPESDWHVEISGRPPMRNSPDCWDRPGVRLGHLATGFAIRHGIAWRRNADLKSLGGADPFQRWGTDIPVTAGGVDVRLLSVHLVTGCWGAEQDREPRREETCAVLRGQIERLRAWGDARQAGGMPFIVLGDFNRRLALPGDWAWRELSPLSAPLRLLTRGEPFGCDLRFPAFIDHIVAGGGAEAMLAASSFREWPREAPHPDHCALSAAFRLGI